MKKNAFGKCTQMAVRKELAKELKVSRSTIELVEMDNVHDPKVFGESLDVPVWHLKYEVHIGTNPTTILCYEEDVMIFDTERVGLVSNELTGVDMQHVAGGTREKVC